MIIYFLLSVISFPTPFFFIVTNWIKEKLNVFSNMSLTFQCIAVVISRSSYKTPKRFIKSQLHKFVFPFKPLFINFLSLFITPNIGPTNMDHPFPFQLYQFKIDRIPLSKLWSLGSRGKSNFSLQFLKNKTYLIIHRKEREREREREREVNYLTAFRYHKCP